MRYTLIVMMGLLAGSALGQGANRAQNVNSNEYLTTVTGLTNGQGGLTLQASWRFSTTTTDADPGSGRFRLNAGDVTNTTQVFISDFTDGGFDSSTILLALDSGDLLYIQERTDSAKSVLYEITNSPVDAVGYVKVLVTRKSDSGGGLFANNKTCGFILYASTGGGGADTTFTNFFAVAGGLLQLTGGNRSGSNTLTLTTQAVLSVSSNAGAPVQISCVVATNTITTNATSFVLMEDMTIPSVAGGSYFAAFNGVVSIDQNNSQVDVRLTAGGIEIVSKMIPIQGAGDQQEITIIWPFTLASTGTVQIEWKINNGSNTGSSLVRSLSILRTKPL